MLVIWFKHISFHKDYLQVWSSHLIPLTMLERKNSIDKLKPTVYYIPNFITEDEEEHLMKHIYEAPKPKWTALSKRRLQNWGGLPQEKGMIPDIIPQWLQTYCDKVASLGAFENSLPNHILVNEYQPGEGIMPHTDGPLYYPTVANITLNSYGVLDWYRPIQSDTGQDSMESEEKNMECQGTSLEDRYIGSVLLERRSLILTLDEMYSNYLHGIAERGQDTITENYFNLEQCAGQEVGQSLTRSKRVSLTIRNVPKVLKAKFLFGKKR